MPLKRPADAEHLQPTIPVWKRAKLRMEYLQTAPAAAPAGYVESDDTHSIVPISGWARFLRLALACIVLLPLSVVMVLALLMQLYSAGDTVSSLNFWTRVPVWYSLLGAATYIMLVIVRITNPILVFIYVLGHELTHALAAKLCFGRVERLHINLDGGYVETDADNLFIALSPYFVPLWMCTWLLGLWVANWVHPFPEWESWFYAGLGFWWCFHLYWTAWVIPREQPDMLENGLLFSLLLVMILNIAILLVILYIFGVITPAGYGHDFLEAARLISDGMRDLYEWLISLSQR